MASLRCLALSAALLGSAVRNCRADPNFRIPARGLTEVATDAQADPEQHKAPETNLLDPAVLKVSCQSFENLTSSSESPIHMYTNGLHNLFYGASNQWIVALVSLAGGICLTWDGPAMWQALFTLAVSAMAAGVACFEAQAYQLGPVAIGMLMIEAALVVAWALYKGFEGSQVLLGAVAGLSGAVGTGAWARALDSKIGGFALFWYCCGAVLGVVTFTLWRRPVLACLAPMLGGFFFATGAGWLMCMFGLRAPFLPQADQPWVEGAVALLGIGGFGAIALYGAPVLIAAALTGIDESRRPLAVGILVLTVFFMALARLCCRDTTNATCTSWLAPEEGWMWPAVGGIIWALVTAFTAWMQLGMLEEESEANAFWSNYYGTLRRRGKRTMYGVHQDDPDDMEPH